MKFEKQLFIAWQVGSIPTLVWLLFFATSYNWWNWIFMIPLNFLLAELWPVYWLLYFLGFGQ